MRSPSNWGKLSMRATTSSSGFTPSGTVPTTSMRSGKRGSPGSNPAPAAARAQHAGDAVDAAAHDLEDLAIAPLRRRPRDDAYAVAVHRVLEERAGDEDVGPAILGGHEREAARVDGDPAGQLVAATRFLGRRSVLGTALLEAEAVAGHLAGHAEAGELVEHVAHFVPARLGEFEGTDHLHEVHGPRRSLGERAQDGFPSDVRSCHLRARRISLAVQGPRGGCGGPERIENENEGGVRSAGWADDRPGAVSALRRFGGARRTPTARI